MRAPHDELLIPDSKIVEMRCNVSRQKTACMHLHVCAVFYMYAAYTHVCFFTCMRLHVCGFFYMYAVTLMRHFFTRMRACLNKHACFYTSMRKSIYYMYAPFLVFYMHACVRTRGTHACLILHTDVTFMRNILHACV